MYIFKKQARELLLKGRTNKYIAENYLDIHPLYLSNILNGKVGCSSRLAKQIVRLINPDAKVNQYFIIKEK